jgi:hypothetical protein
MSKFFTYYNFNKLLEESLHAQNAMRLRVPRLIVEVLCLIHREPAGGEGIGGREQWKGGGFWMKAR